MEYLNKSSSHLKIFSSCQNVLVSIPKFTFFIEIVHFIGFNKLFQTCSLLMHPHYTIKHVYIGNISKYLM